MSREGHDHAKIRSGAIRSSSPVNNTMTRRAIDSSSEYHGTSASTSESHRGDLIIQRYDRSGWIVGLLQCSHSFKGARQVKGQGRVVERGEEATTSPERLSYPSAMHWSEREWTRRSVTVPQRRIYRSQRKGRRCKTMDSRVMGLAAPWYRRSRTSVESSIPCSHGGRALVIKGAEEVENAEANSKYQDSAEGQRP
ncbi:hypothetical protein BHE74_00024631 [Ensete ventricosum]|nr:hypothetical protein BHE74_00024631 [Ensete ventricosum]